MTTCVASAFSHAQTRSNVDGYWPQLQGVSRVERNPTSHQPPTTVISSSLVFVGISICLFRALIEIKTDLEPQSSVQRRPTSLNS